METVSNTTAAPLDISRHVAAVELSTAETKLLASVSKALRDLAAAMPADANEATGSGEKSAMYAIGPDFDPVAVDRLRMQCALSGEAHGRFKKRIRQIASDHHRAVLDKPELSDLAARVIDATAEAVRGDAKKHAEALAASPFASAGISDQGAQAAVAETLRILGEKRGQAVRDPQAAWEILQSYGLTD